MPYKEILYSVERGIATLTLNRPEKLNAWTGLMEREVREAMTAAGKDDAVRVIIFTGAGRGFCAGADMGLLSSISEGTSERRAAAEGNGSHASNGSENFSKQYSYFPAIEKPIICAINGAAAGLGLVMSLYCDFRFASDQAKFTTAFSRRGLISEHGISWLLPRITGLANALDLLYSARKFDAAEALRMGLVSRVIAQDNLMAETRAYAEMLATEVSPRSLRVIKQLCWNAQFQNLGEAIDDANVEMRKSFACEDFKEGVAHFMEKRAPAFTGR